MEIELKYDLGRTAEDPAVILESTLVQNVADGAVSIFPMNAIYYDTEDLALAKEKIAFRIRQEGTHFVGTLKWNSETTEALSCREEMNIQLTEEDLQKGPSLAIFDQSGIADLLAQAVGDKPLVPLMEMRFLRKQVRLDTGHSISELSIDIGEVEAGGNTCPIHELELEYYSGSREDDRTDFLLASGAQEQICTRVRFA